VGPVEVWEQVYQRGSRTFRPTCAQLGIECGYYSRGLQEAVVDFGAEDSFALAAERLQRHHPVKLSAGTIRKITLRHAQVLQRRHARKSCLGKLPARGAGQLIAEADGTMLPQVDFKVGRGASADRRKNRTTGWREARLCAVQELGKTKPVYGCDLTSVESLGARWSHCAGQARWGLNSNVHVVSDGAAWIARQVSQCFGSKTQHLLDLYHVVEYLAGAQKARPEWMNPRRRWLKTQKNRLLRNQADKVLRELQPHLEPAHCEEKDAPIRKAFRYLGNHLDKLDYLGARKNGLPLGSGLIEGAHRHVLQKRLKISGAWWTSANLHAMTQLRVCRANQQWDDYWRDAA